MAEQSSTKMLGDKLNCVDACFLLIEITTNCDLNDFKQYFQTKFPNSQTDEYKTVMQNILKLFSVESKRKILITSILERKTCDGCLRNERDEKDGEPKPEEFDFILLPLPSANNNPSIADCFNEYLGKLVVKCGKCGEIRKGISPLIKFPKLLVVVVKKNDQSDVSERVSISCGIKIPFSNEDLKQKKSKFKLVGMIDHQGDVPDENRYRCFFIKKKNQFVGYENDELKTLSLDPNFSPNLDPSVLIFRKTGDEEETSDGICDEIKPLFSPIPNDTIAEHKSSGFKEVLSKSFQQQFQGEEAKNFLKQILRSSLSREHYRYLAMFQSSGYGKSKIAFEIAQKHLFTIYWCCRPPLLNGYPYRTNFIANTLENLKNCLKTSSFSSSMTSKQQKEMEDFLPRDFLEEIDELYHPFYREIWFLILLSIHRLCKLYLWLFNFSSFEGVDVGNFLYYTAKLQFIECYDPPIDLKVSTGFRSVKYKKQMKMWQNQPISEMMESLEAVKTLLKSKKLMIDGKSWTNKVPILLCVDESRNLLPGNDKSDIAPSIFRFLRKSLTSISPKSCKTNFFGVFIDTLSRISNFCAPDKLNVSSRIANTPSLKLHHPFYQLCTADLFNQDPHNRLDPNFLTFSDLRRYGRPLWEIYKTESVIELAEQKLAEGLSNYADDLKDPLISMEELVNDHEKYSNLHQTALAMICARIPIQIFAGQIPSDLVGGHMATCQHVVKSRELIYINYPSEPILAEGAAVGFWDSEKGRQFMKKCITYVERFRGVPLGDRGEIVAQIILLETIDKLIKNSFPERISFFDLSPFEKLIPVKKFLKEIVGTKFDRSKANYFQKLDPTIEIGKESEDIFVCFNHFVQLYSLPTPNILKQLAFRCGAAALQKGQTGADFMIPLIKVQHDWKDKNGTITQKKLGMLLIQIKNATSADDISNICEKIQPEKVFEKKKKGKKQKVEEEEEEEEEGSEEVVDAGRGGFPDGVINSLKSENLLICLVLSLNTDSNEAFVWEVCNHLQSELSKVEKTITEAKSKDEKKNLKKKRDTTQKKIEKCKDLQKVYFRKYNFEDPLFQELLCDNVPICEDTRVLQKSWPVDFPKNTFQSNRPSIPSSQSSSSSSTITTRTIPSSASLFSSITTRKFSSSASLFSSITTRTIPSSASLFSSITTPTIPSSGSLFSSITTRKFSSSGSSSSSSSTKTTPTIPSSASLFSSITTRKFSSSGSSSSSSSSTKTTPTIPSSQSSSSITTRKIPSSQSSPSSSLGKRNENPSRHSPPKEKRPKTSK